MSPLADRIGGFRRYVPAALVILAGAVLALWPGSVGSDTSNALFVGLGSMLAIGGVAWLLLQLDRQVSDDPRYQRPVYTEDEDEDQDTEG